MLWAEQPSKVNHPHPHPMGVSAGTSRSQRVPRGSSKPGSGWGRGVMRPPLGAVASSRDVDVAPAPSHSLGGPVRGEPTCPSLTSRRALGHRSSSRALCLSLGRRCRGAGRGPDP